MKQVVVGIISKIENGEEKYLLVSSTRDFGEFTGFYYPPGGHLDGGEDEKSALVREIVEELNVEVKPIAKLATTAGDVTDQTTTWWACEIAAEASITVDKDEIADLKWLTRAQILSSEKIWPATKDFFEKYID